MGTPSPIIRRHALTPTNNNKDDPQDENQNLSSTLPSTDTDDTIIESSFSLATSATTKQDDGDDDATVWKARALLIGAAALYGTNFSLVKLLGDTMPEGVSLTLRFALASAVTLPLLFDEGGIQLPKADVLMATWLGFG